MDQAPAEGPPIVLIDVDGVLNPAFSSKKRSRLAYHDGWISTWGHVDGDRYRLFLNPEHGRQLRKLANDTGAELAWGTTWAEHANYEVGPLIGLPVLPVATVRIGAKGESVQEWTNGRPWVWFDDQWSVLTEASEKATEQGQRHLAVKVDPAAGLQPEHLAEARDWLTAVNEADGPPP